MDAISNLETKEGRSTSSPSPRFPGRPPAISKYAAILAAGLFALIFALHWLYLNHFRWDSDELQHLHVLWAWGSGLLPYRHVFDNHSPRSGGLEDGASADDFLEWLPRVQRLCALPIECQLLSPSRTRRGPYQSSWSPSCLSHNQRLC